MSDATHGSALYYPAIVPQDLGALKSSLLYWDRVRRIVPSYLRDGDGMREDPERVKPFVSAGLLCSSDPRPYKLKAAERLREIRPVLDEQLELRVRHAAAENIEMHEEKLSDALLRDLRREGHVTARDAHGWVGMRRDLAGFYMHCLASAMSDDMRSPLVTDNVKSARIGHWLAFGKRSPAKQREQVLESFMNIGMCFPSPERLAAIPTDTFLDFHKKHASERRAFRERLEAIVEATSSLSSADAVADVLADHRSQLEEANRNYQRTWFSIGLEAAYESANIISFPTGIIAVGESLAAVNLASTLTTGILAGFGAAGLCFGLAKVATVTYGAIKDAHLTNPYHYLARASKLR